MSHIVNYELSRTRASIRKAVDTFPLSSRSFSRWPLSHFTISPPLAHLQPSSSYSQTSFKAGSAPHYLIPQPIMTLLGGSKNTHGRGPLLKVEDSVPYRHLEKGLVVDAITRKPVSPNTTLATLYDFNTPNPGEATVDGALIRDLANTVRPHVPCRLFTSEGEACPPKYIDGQLKCNFEVTYRNLLLAPVVRLEARLQASSPIKIAVEFHFNDYLDHEDNAISLYAHNNNSITFWAGRATGSGFGLVTPENAKLDDEAQKLVDTLKSFVESSERRRITLRLDESKLTPEDKEHLAKVRSRLPGGAGKTLPSIGVHEYAAFGGSVSAIRAGRSPINHHRSLMRTPAQLISGPAPHPMVPLDCGPSFSTVKEAAVQLAYSVVVGDVEWQESLRLWAAIRHRGQFLLSEKFAILALKNNPFDRLGGMAAGVDLFRLPSDIHCSFRFVHPMRPNMPMSVNGFLMSVSPVGGHDAVFKPDAYFRITSHDVAKLKSLIETGKSSVFDVKCTPHYSSFTFTSQLETVGSLQSRENQRWHPLLLNQGHDALEGEDFTAGVDPKEKKRADDWLLNWKDWNPEQLEVLKGITNAKGGMSIVMGPAATGKTLLQRALAIYFYNLGYHVLALAPANDNVNKLARDLLEVKAELEKKADSEEPSEHSWLELDFCRLFPGSRNVKVDELTEKQALLRKIGHEGGNVLPFSELLIALDAMDEEAKKPAGMKNRGLHREYGLIETIVKAADEKKLSLPMNIRADAGLESSAVVDAWEVLRELIAEHRGGELGNFIAAYIATIRNRDNHPNEAEMLGIKYSKYRTAYRACKGHIVYLNRFMITTTGSVKSTELLNYWFNAPRSGPDTRKGVIVFVDEAAKDLEVNVWSGIVCEKWAQQVKGVFLFGDDKQLTPPNTSAKGGVKFNYFSQRLDTTLPNRLVEQGFPCHYLREQRRMHAVISDFPNREIYEGRLRNGPGMHALIDDQMPGLRDVLTAIIANGIEDPTERKKFCEKVTEASLRRHYIEVSGMREAHEATKSVKVQSHISLFFRKIWPRLHQFFRATGRSMNREVMVICAYNHARNTYLRAFRDFLARHRDLTPDDIPRVASIDASQGDEAYMVFFDGSAQQADRVGFMTSPHRFNVAVTRAKGVLWVIGGRLLTGRWKSGGPRHLLAEYKAELDAAGQTHRFHGVGRAPASSSSSPRKRFRSRGTHHLDGKKPSPSGGTPWMKRLDLS